MAGKKKDPIQVTCEAAATIELDDLIPFQGDLKELPEASYQKLRQAILKHGFSFPFYIWKDGGKNYCIDGHQRDKVLRRLRDEGHLVPPLPVAFVQAKDKAQAKEKLLLASSAYGEIKPGELKLLVEESHLDLAELKLELNLPELDLLDIDGNFKKESFDSIVDKFSTTKKSMKDGSWFYVEYYGNAKLYDELKALLRMRTDHEVDAIFFAGLVKGKIPGGQKQGKPDDKARSDKE